jgi:GNAT superfamily N-acetyltransferase
LVSGEKKFDYKRQIVLLDGSNVVIRSICPDDRRALIDFHARQSNETRFLRYHYLKGDLTEEDLHTFCDVDNVDNVALVVEREKSEQNEIIAVGRFYRLPTRPHRAEVAFVVQDSEQGKGIGTQLLKYLALIAWERDIYFFVGEVLKENFKMLSIFLKSDPVMYLKDETEHTCYVTLAVQQIIDTI